MDGWMDGCMGWMDGWMDGMDGWMDGWEGRGTKPPLSALRLSAAWPHQVDEPPPIGLRVNDGLVDAEADQDLGRCLLAQLAQVGVTTGQAALLRALRRALRGGVLLRIAPAEWKSAVVAPLFKGKGPRGAAGLYQGVAFDLLLVKYLQLLRRTTLLSK
eukprot:365189-Chlamydomonas_euryale.AAC.2